MQLQLAQNGWARERKEKEACQMAGRGKLVKMQPIILGGSSFLFSVMITIYCKDCQADTNLLAIT